MWPVDDDEFEALVSCAVKDHRSDMARRVRDKLANPDVIGRTVLALERIVERVDEHLLAACDDDVRRRREHARDGFYEALNMYRVLANGEVP